MPAVNEIKQNFGFTLIELLVVISIIGLLSSVVLVSLNSARIKARNMKRIANMKQLATALNIYYMKNNAWPVSASGGKGCWGPWQSGNSINTGMNFLKPLVDDGIMLKTPLEDYWNFGNASILNWSSPGCNDGVCNTAICTYRYLPNMDFSAKCGVGFNNVAVLYTYLEKPRSEIAGAESGTAPQCVSDSGWGEASVMPNDYNYSDPNGYLLLVR